MPRNILDRSTNHHRPHLPDQTESAVTVGGGNLQIESGMVYSEEGEEFPSKNLIFPTTLFRYGIIDALELRLVSQVETDYSDEEELTGFSDLELGLKLHIYGGNSSKHQIAVMSHAILSTGSSHLTTHNSTGWVNKLLVSHDLTDKMSVGYNLGYSYFGKIIGEVQDAFTYSLALGFGVNDKVGIYIEPYGEYFNSDEWVHDFDAGVTYLLNPKLQFDFSFGTGLSRKMNYVAFGISWIALKN